MSRRIKARSSLSIAQVGQPNVLIAVRKADSSATVNFDNVFSDKFESYVCYFSGVIPETNDREIWVRVGTGATPTYHSGAGDYRDGTSGQAQIEPISSSGVSNAAGDSCAGILTIYNPADVDKATMFDLFTGKINTSGGYFSNNDGEVYSATTAVTSLQFFAETGNILSGEFYLYGRCQAGVAS